MKKVLFILLVGLVFVACKKEDRIQKNLWKQGGEWNIDTWSYRMTSTNPSDNESNMIANYGTIRFNKDGSGNITYTENNSAYTESFTYTNTENTITIFDVDGNGTIFDLDWKRNEITMVTTYKDSYSSFDENFNPITVHTTSTTTLKCSKNK